MSKIVNTLPKGAKVRQMDTLAFKEFMHSGADIAQCQKANVSYFESARGGFIYITRQLADACDRFYRTIHIQALSLGSDGDKALQEGGLMLWDAAGVNQTRRHFYFNHPTMPEANMSILADWTRVPE